MDTYVILDIETTGLSRYKNKITEIAAVKIIEGEIIDRFETLVNPQEHIPSFITHLTGIDDEMVKDARTIDKILPEFLKFIEDYAIVGHNVTFDYGFLNYNSVIYLEKEIPNKKICTKKLANRILPELPSKKLSTICEHFEIINQNAHRAMADVLATTEIFNRFRNILSDFGIKELDDLLEFESMPRQKTEKIMLIN